MILTLRMNWRINKVAVSRTRRAESAESWENIGKAAKKVGGEE
jgi:hypothetical protein